MEDTRRLPCSCWCEAAEVMIPVEWIRVGATDSCGRPGCHNGCQPRAQQDEVPTNPTQPTNQSHRTDRGTTAMTKTYNPRLDEAAEIPAALTGARPGDLHLIVGEPAELLCGCGCGEPRGPKTRFRMGHDIRLRGKLMRLGAHGGKVVEVTREPAWQVTQISGVLEYAALFSTPTLDWVVNVQEGIERAVAGRSKARVAAAEKAVLAKATGPQEGDKILIKVGRWDKTGKIAAIYKYEDGTDVMEVEYVDAKGGIQTARREGFGAWKVAK